MAFTSDYLALQSSRENFTLVDSLLTQLGQHRLQLRALDVLLELSRWSRLTDGLDHGNHLALGQQPDYHWRLQLAATLDGGDQRSYLLLLLTVTLAFGLVALLAFLARSAGTSFTAITLAKQAPYECGFQPFERLDRCSLFLFYRLAIFFVIFEAELIFLYPWVTNLLAGGGDPAFFGAALPFLGLLLLGFAWEIERGALNL